MTALIEGICITARHHPRTRTRELSAQQRASVFGTVINLDQSNVGCRIRRRNRDLVGIRRADVSHMSMPAVGPFDKLDLQAISATNNVGSCDRIARRDEECCPLRPCIGVETGRAGSQQTFCCVFASHFGSDSSLWDGDSSASHRSQEATTLTCALPPTSASTLNRAPGRATISIPNSTSRESGRCSSRASHTEVTTPRTVSANPCRCKASTAGAIRSLSPTSVGPAVCSPVAADSATCTRTHIGSPLGSITWAISDVVPPSSRFGDPAPSKVLRAHSHVKTTVSSRGRWRFRIARLC